MAWQRQEWVKENSFAMACAVLAMYRRGWRHSVGVFLDFLGWNAVRVCFAKLYEMTYEGEKETRPKGATIVGTDTKKRDW
jgi:hypothetical protein